jgi:hypothetical protein
MMSTRSIDPLLLAATSALLLVSLYALWLWLRLWFIRKALSEIRDLLSQRDRPKSPEVGSGCGGFLFLLLMIAVGIDLLILTR